VAVALLSAPIANWMIRTIHFRVPLVFGESVMGFWLIGRSGLCGFGTVYGGVV
jgi:hypothetical protein